MIKQILAYLKEQKKLWLLPFFITTLITVLIAVLLKLISVSPFIYTLF